MPHVGGRPAPAHDVLVEVLPGADAEGEAAVGQQREGRRLLGDHRRVVAQDRAGDVRHERDALGHLRDGAEDGPGGRGVAHRLQPGVEVVAGDQEVEPGLLGEHRVADEVLRGALLAHERVADLHVLLLGPGRARGPARCPGHLPCPGGRGAQGDRSSAAGRTPCGGCSRSTGRCWSPTGSVEVLAHRVLWSLVAVAVLVRVLRRGRQVREVAARPAPGRPAGDRRRAHRRQLGHLHLRGDQRAGASRPRSATSSTRSSRCCSAWSCSASGCGRCSGRRSAWPPPPSSCSPSRPASRRTWRWCWRRRSGPTGC